MYGETANKLIHDARRTANLPEVPLYQAELVKEVVNEINDLAKDVEYLLEQERLESEEGETFTEEEVKIRHCQLFVANLTMRRNKRCLLAYERLRAEKISEFAWLNIDPSVDSSSAGRQAAANMSASGVYSANYTTQLALDNLSHSEQEYMKKYQELLVDYKSNFADIDLSGDLEPPKNLFIDVRVLKDGGEVQTEYGVFNLIKDSQFYVRKSDVERLIQQGYLEEL